MGAVMRGLAVALTLVAAGCAGLAEQRRLEQFEKTARAYDKAIRWSDFQAAYSLTRPDPNRPPNFERLKRVQVTSYETLGATPAPGGTEVRQSVAIEYMFINSMRVLRLIDPQVWVFDEAAGRWQLTSGLPDFK